MTGVAESRRGDTTLRVLLALAVGLFSLLALVVVVGVLTRDPTYGGPLGILTGCLLGVIAGIGVRAKGGDR